MRAAARSNRYASARRLGLVALVGLAACGGPKPRPQSPGSGGDGLALLPASTRLVVQMAPEQARAALDAVEHGRGLPEDFPLRQLQHPAGFLTRMVLLDRPLRRLRSRLGTRRGHGPMPSMRHLDPARPVRLAVATTGEQEFFERARRLHAVGPEQARARVAHLRLVLPARDAQALLGEIRRWCEPDEGHRPRCEHLVSSRADEGWVLLDVAVDPPGVGDVPATRRLRRTLSSSGAGHWKPRRTPALARFLDTPATLSIYARSEDLWALAAFGRGSGEDVAFDALVRAAATRLLADSLVREGEDFAVVLDVAGGDNPSQAELVLEGRASLTKAGARAVGTPAELAPLPALKLPPEASRVTWQLPDPAATERPKPPAWLDDEPPWPDRRSQHGRRPGREHAASSQAWPAWTRHVPRRELLGLLTSPTTTLLAAGRGTPLQRAGAGADDTEPPILLGGRAGVHVPRDEDGDIDDEKARIAATMWSNRRWSDDEVRWWLRKTRALPRELRHMLRGGIRAADAHVEQTEQDGRVRIDIALGATRTELMDPSRSRSIEGRAMFEGAVDLAGLLGTDPSYSDLRDHPYLALGKLGMVKLWVGRLKDELAFKLRFGQGDLAPPQSANGDPADLEPEPQPAAGERCRRSWRRWALELVKRDDVLGTTRSYGVAPNARERLETLEERGAGCDARSDGAKAERFRAARASFYAAAGKELLRWNKLGYAPAAQALGMACRLGDKTVCERAERTRKIAGSLELPSVPFVGSRIARTERTRGSGRRDERRIAGPVVAVTEQGLWLNDEHMDWTAGAGALGGRLAALVHNHLEAERRARARQAAWSTKAPDELVVTLAADGNVPAGKVLTVLGELPAGRDESKPEISVQVLLHGEDGKRVRLPIALPLRDIDEGHKLVLLGTSTLRVLGEDVPAEPVESCRKTGEVACGGATLDGPLLESMSKRLFHEWHEAKEREASSSKERSPFRNRGFERHMMRKALARADVDIWVHPRRPFEDVVRLVGHLHAEKHRLSGRRSRGDSIRLTVPFVPAPERAAGATGSEEAP